MFQRFSYLLDGDLSSVIGADTVTAATEAAGAVTADPTLAAQPGGLFNSVWIIVLYGAIIIGAYFLLMRPQRKREKKMREMQASIKAGDNVITSGGFFGRIADVGEDCFIVEFGTNRGIRVPIQKSDVLGIRAPKTTPAPKETTES